MMNFLKASIMFWDPTKWRQNKIIVKVSILTILLSNKSKAMFFSRISGLINAKRRFLELMKVLDLW